MSRGVERPVKKPTGAGAPVRVDEVHVAGEASRLQHGAKREQQGREDGECLTHAEKTRQRDCTMVGT